MIGLEYTLAATIVLFFIAFIGLVKTCQNTKRVKVKIETLRDPNDVFASKTKR